MLTSLFGEFGPRRLPSDAPAPGAVAARVEEIDAAVDTNPAASMRSHLAATRLDLGQASSMITLIDPARQWAGRVLRALSEAGGQVVERLNLRDRATLAREVEGGMIENIYRLQVMNVSESAQRYSVKAQGLDGLQMLGDAAIELAPGSAKTITVQIRVPPESGKRGSNPIFFDVVSMNDAKVAVHEKATFIQP